MGKARMPMYELHSLIRHVKACQGMPKMPKMPKPHGPMSIMNPDLQVGQRAAKHLDTHRNCLGSRREELRLTYQDCRENPEIRWN